MFTLRGDKSKEPIHAREGHELVLRDEMIMTLTYARPEPVKPAEAVNLLGSRFFNTS